MLEKKLKQHADEIFGSELAEGHRERFVAKLAVQSKRTKPNIVRMIFVYTAAAAALIAAVFTAQRFMQPADVQEYEPIDDVRNYYSALLDSEFEQTWQQARSLDEPSREALYRDMIDLRAETGTLDDVEDINSTLIVGVYTSKIETLRHIREIIDE